MRAGPIALAAVAALLLVALLSQPPAPLVLAPAADAIDGGVRGVVHVHTRRSDGSGTVEEVAAAAAEAGLDFVVLTDHGDATRMPAPPARHDGVLVIDAVEIGTWDGHVVALGLPQAPYPLAGEGRDVVEDVARLGGFAIAAHPDSPRDGLRWHDWDVPVDGLEWLNGDSTWRDEGPLALLRTLLTYPLRPAATLAALADRPEGLLERWDALTRERRVVALAGSDAHARIAARRDHTGGGGIGLPVPGYAAMFRTFGVVLPDLVLAGEAGADAAAVIDAIRGGRLYSVVDGLATPGRLQFQATSGVHAAAGGDILPLDGPVAVDVRTNAPPGARLVLYRDGRPAAETTGDRLTYEGPAARAVYRVEAYLARAPGTPPVPWIVSNPIYVGWPQEEREDVPRETTAPLAGPPVAARAPAWSVEASANGLGAIDRVPDAPQDALFFRYALGGTRDEGPFVAFVTREVDALRTADGLSFTIRADRPARLSIQVRAAGERLERWHRSVYADDTARPVVVRFDDMRPRGDVSTARPVAAEIESLLVVIDSVNTTLGSGGRVRIDALSALPP